MQNKAHQTRQLLLTRIHAIDAQMCNTEEAQEKPDYLTG